MGAVRSPLADEVQALFSLEESLVQDPYPLYERLRADAPVLQYDETTVIVSRYAEAKAVYRDPERFPVAEERGVRFAGKFDLLDADDRSLLEENLAFEKLFMTNRNGDDHRRVRGAAQRAFTPRRVAQLQPLVVATCDELLDEHAGDAQFDFTDVASLLPLYVVMDMLGVPRPDALTLKQWSDDINVIRRVVPPEVVRTAHAALTSFRAYVADLVERHRRRGDVQGLVADLLAAEGDNRLSDDEIVAVFVHLLFAGHETTTNLIGNGLHALLDNPQEWDRVRDDPSLAAGAVEEVLRWDSPVQFFQRQAAAGATIAGEPVSPGSFVVMLNASANRDPEVFEDPDRFDVTRRPNDHLSFGYGTHFCIGAAVARLEARTILETLARRFPDLEPAADLAELRIHPNISLRGYEAFPLRLGRPAS
jgi:cytochrome P450